MAHDHHHGESAGSYFVEQLLTIFVVGLLGLVGVLMYRDGRLGYILAPGFHLPVLIGGIAVLVLVVVRAVSVWREAGRMRLVEHHHDHAHEPGHVHGPDCDHSHDHDHHSADDHGHSHDIAWVFTRMLILFFPVALYMVNIPNSGFSQEGIEKRLGKDEQVTADLGSVAQGEGSVMSFDDLNGAAFDQGKREALSGKIGVVEGRFRRIAEKQFSLYRMKMTCCATDMTPLKVRIITPTALSGMKDHDWVRVKGEVRFVQSPSSGRYIPVIAVADIGDVVVGTAPSAYE